MTAPIVAVSLPDGTTLPLGDSGLDALLALGAGRSDRLVLRIPGGCTLKLAPRAYGWIWSSPEPLHASRLASALQRGTVEDAAAALVALVLSPPARPRCDTRADAPDEVGACSCPVLP